MNKPALRAAVTILALLAIASGAGAVRGAEQPTVGGTLSAAANTITVFSNGNVPARVYMSAESVTLSEREFDLAPGESHSLTFTGKAVGYVKALYVALGVTGQESGSAELAIGLAPYIRPIDWSWLGYLILAAVGLGLVLRKVRPWQWRIVRTTP